MKIKASKRAMDTLKKCRSFKEKPGDDASGSAYWNGASLHIVLCDQNMDIDSILHCRKRAERIGDSEAVNLANAILSLSRPEREYLGATL